MRRAGFTLIEVLVTVAIIGILVGIAIMSFSKQARKAKGGEANAMFASLRIAQEQYHLENGVYLSTGTGETDVHPMTPGKARQTILPLPSTWGSLKVKLPEENVFCGYVSIAGRGGDGTGLGVKAAEFGLTVAPTTDWYYLLARCDLDGNGSRDSYYFTWSGDTRVQKQNEGF